MAHYNSKVVLQVFIFQINKLILCSTNQLTKSESKDMYNSKTFLFQINDVLLNFLFIKVF